MPLHAMATATAGPSSAALMFALGLLLALAVRLAESVRPALDVDLLDPGERQRATWNILGHGGAGSDVGIAPDRHRRHQLAVGTDERTGLDRRLVRAESVVVAGDRAGTDVGLGADRRIAEVGLARRAGPVFRWARRRERSDKRWLYIFLDCSSRWRHRNLLPSLLRVFVVCVVTFGFLASLVDVLWFSHDAPYEWPFR